MKSLKYIIILTALVSFGCGTEGPSGKKMIFASQMPVTRAITDNYWDGGERVFISIDGQPARIFTVAAGGMLTPLDDLWWQSSTQTVTARAWYPDPAFWEFPADQSGGFRAADFVFAPTVSGIRFNNYLANPLRFNHLPAKVVVNLAAGMDIGSVDEAVVSFYGYVAGEVDTDNGAIVGSDSGWITPLKTSDTYTALLIPRDMTGVKFIKITLGGYDYYYTPAADEATLTQGNTFIYNISVDKTRLTVTVVENGAVWDDSGDEDTVTAEPV